MVQIREQRSSVSFSTQTLLVYMICMEMFGSGVWITGIRIMKRLLLIVLPGWIKMPQKMLIECCAAAPGATIRGIVAPPLATGAGPTIVTTTSVFASFPPRGLFRSPLPFYTLYFFHFTLARSASNFKILWLLQQHN
jgi:hypothetical protein